jgi:glycosyltransferase involved in cell wall biosynthesis
MRVVVDLCATLAARGHDVTLFTCDATDVPAGWTAGDPRTPRVTTLDRLSRFTKLLPGRSVARLRQDLPRFDVLHLHGPWETANLQFARIARQIKLPYLLTVHGTLDDWSMAQQPLKKRLYLKLAARGLMERAAGVQCTAAAELEQARRHMGRARGVVLPCLIDLSPFEQLPGPEPALTAFPDARTDLPKVLFLSRLHPVKRVELLIEATRLLRDGGKPVRLLVAGAGEPAYDARLRQHVRAAGLDDHVKFLGMVRGVEKTSVYQLADVFAHPSQQENFGLVLPEAMASGTPVVTTRGVDIWQEIEPAGAVIVEPTAEAFAGGIARLLADPGRRGIGQRGRRWVFETLGPDQLLGRYEATYAAAIGGGPMPGPPARRTRAG